MSTLFYADVLGMKARWRTGDIEAVKTTYRAFEQMIGETLAAERCEPITGGIQSDAAAIVFEDAIDAVRFARTLFMRTFYDARRQSRLWFRGLVCPCSDEEELISERPLERGPRLYARHFADDLLQAVNIEQQFRGPRVLLARSLVDSHLKNALAIHVGRRKIWPMRQLDHVSYPAAGDWWDLLYLLPPEMTDEELSSRDAQIDRLLRWTISEKHGGSREEFEQIAVLAVVWAESFAIARHVASTARSGPRPS